MKKYTGKKKRRIPVFLKLVAAFVIVSAIGFTMSGILLYSQLYDYIYSEKEKDIEKAIENTEDSLDAYFETLFNSSASDNLIQWRYDELKLTMERESKYLGGAMLWIVDDDGIVIYSYPEIPTSVISKYDGDMNGHLRLQGDAFEYIRTLSDVNSTITGSFFGFFDNEEYTVDGASEKWISMSRANKYTSGGANDNVTIANLVVHLPLPSMNEMLYTIIRMVILSLVVAMIVSFTVAAIISKSFSEPISNMNMAAKRISKGDFSKPVRITRNDEMGELSHNFNNMMYSLKNLDKMRNDFISNVSHELRTPTTSILGFLDGILDGTIPEDKKEYYLSIVRDEMTRLNKMVNELLELSKMEAGQLKLNFEKCNISELCRICLINMEQFINEKQINIEADFGDNDLYAICDRGSIQQVIINIMFNAIKFVPIGGIIKLYVYENKNKIWVTIIDNGPGISSSDLPHIWDRFYKADKSRGLNKQGTGLGLAIVKNIINSHNETIIAGNMKTGGAIFTFSLSKIEV